MTRRRRFVWLAILCVLAAVLLAYSLHLPDRRRFTITYVGTPPQLPKSYTLLEEWWPTREIPFVSTRIRFMRPRTDIIEFGQRKFEATPGGITGEVNLNRTLSLGQYQMGGVLASDYEPQPLYFGGYGDRPERLEGGITYVDYHFLDVARSDTTFRVPLTWEEGSRDLRVTIDFEPIAYTSFVGLPNHREWSQSGTRCDPLLLSPGLVRTLRYETGVMPAPRPGQRRPRWLPAEAVVVDSTHDKYVFHRERPTPADWAEIKALAGAVPGLQVTHDREAGTIALLLTAEPDPASPLVKQDVLVLVAAPSAEGRFFGMDCLRLQVEEREWFNPIVYTVLEGLSGRERWHMDNWGTRCSDPKLPRLHLEPGVERTVRYRTLVRQSSPDAEVGQPIPSPRGATDAFLVKVEDLAGRSERMSEVEWDALRAKAVRPAGVRLKRSGGGALALRTTEPMDGDVALVVGTRSSDHRFFGFDCARLDTSPAPASSDP